MSIYLEKNSHNTEVSPYILILTCLIIMHISDTVESPETCDNMKLRQNEAYEYRMPINLKMKHNPAYEYCQHNIHECL